MQQQGETFDDFLVSLRELAKTCNFCSDACAQKGIRDQIIECLLDGQTVEDLLKEKDLTLASTVSKCRAHEAAKRQRQEITGGSQELGVQKHSGEHALFPNRPHLPLNRLAQDVGHHSTQEAASSAQPSAWYATRATRLATSPKYANHASPRNPHQVTRRRIHLLKPCPSLLPSPAQ